MRWQRWIRRDDGAMALLVAVLISVVLFGVAAVVVDVGSLYLSKRDLQTSADAAALAGVRDLPGDTDAARTSALYYLSQNIREGLAETPQIDISNDTITVTVVGNAPLFFARTWGMTVSPVKATATAIVGTPTGYQRGVMPFGIMAEDASEAAAFGYEFGDQVLLKRSPQAAKNDEKNPPKEGSERGNFHIVSIKVPPGAHEGTNDLRDWIQGGGSPNPVAVGDQISTITGAAPKAGEWLDDWIELGDDEGDQFGDVAEDNHDGTFNIDWSSHRVIVCPIIVNPTAGLNDPEHYNWLGLPGVSQEVEVIGFAYFFVESTLSADNKFELTGRFIRPVLPSDPGWDLGSIDPYGGIGFRLVD